MLKLIIGNKNYSSWSLRPWVALRMADVPFEEELQPFVDHGSHDTFRAFSPTGRVPLLVDGAINVWDHSSPGIASPPRMRSMLPWPSASRPMASPLGPYLTLTRRAFWHCRPWSNGTRPALLRPGVNRTTRRKSGQPAPLSAICAARPDRRPPCPPTPPLLPAFPTR